MTHEFDTLAPFKRLLAVTGAGLLGAAALAGCGILEESGSDSDATEVSGEAVDAAAEAAAGDCLPQEVIGADSGEFAIDCADPLAYWTITAITADSDAVATGGTLADPQPAFDLCGEEVGAYVPGKLRTDWNMIYDQTTGAVDYLFCIEAIDKVGEDGRTPKVPDTGECFASADLDWATLPCDSAEANSTVISATTFEVADWAAPDVEGALADCAGGYYELIDQFDRTSGVICFE
ncbi:hypothetical protein L0U85_18900 [Glycomyces sp. L485]|uniref:hypothetical protein n=1 Tax=Glycomyces sp. L485 TaxID=2909235 RepID=UPI001F4B7337|nr:hypothetical protein [Glycomyces sp. L485]MCH7232905.1 hypothetical protein [Glycomyces sp. L485]